MFASTDLDQGSESFNGCRLLLLLCQAGSMPQEALSFAHAPSHRQRTDDGVVSGQVSLCIWVCVQLVKGLESVCTAALPAEGLNQDCVRDGVWSVACT